MEVINEKITEKITEEEKRVKLRQCASLLAPSSTADWVSCTQQVEDLLQLNAKIGSAKIYPASSTTLLSLDCLLLNWF